MLQTSPVSFEKTQSRILKYIYTHVYKNMRFSGLVSVCLPLAHAAMWFFTRRRELGCMFALTPECWIAAPGWAELWIPSPLWACFRLVVFFFFLSGKCNIACASGYRASNVVTIVFSPTSTHISVSLHLILSCFILVLQASFLLFTRLKEKQCSLYFTFPAASTLHLLKYPPHPPTTTQTTFREALCCSYLYSIKLQFVRARWLMISQLLSHGDRKLLGGEKQQRRDES